MPAVAESRPGVKAALTAQAAPHRPVVENGAYVAFARRVLRAAGRRVAAGDVDGLADLVALSADVDACIGEAVSGLRGVGYSWGEIAGRIGTTRQAAQQRWGGLMAGDR